MLIDRGVGVSLAEAGTTGHRLNRARSEGLTCHLLPVGSYSVSTSESIQLKMYSTPTQPRTRHSSLQTPIQHSAAESRRALGQASASRTGGTPRAGPLGKVLAREGISGASPRGRKVRRESWTAK